MQSNSAAAALVDIPALREHAAGIHGALVNLAEKSFAAVDSVTHELIRVRLAQLSGNAAEAARRTPGITMAGEKLSALPQWPTSPHFSAAERACLEFAEQYYIDVAGMTDAFVARLLRHYDSPAIFALVHAIYTIDGAHRTRALLDGLLKD
ncbi:MAG: hypothetical protein FJY55_04255 [Betaproteobacteria bacterium]|nr:hypothetical protein [Betaproteobacteria bacterium]